jgi:hypothetical protein
MLCWYLYMAFRHDAELLCCSCISNPFVVKRNTAACLLNRPGVLTVWEHNDRKTTRLQTQLQHW